MMKKILFFIVSFFLLPCITQAKNVVALGDSITTGYGVEEGESYVSLFCKELKMKTRNDVQCDNLAVNGLTSSGLIDILQVEETKSKIKKSDFILISIGGNDFLNKLTSNLSTYLSFQESYPQVSVIGETLTQNLSTILDEIISINPHVKIFLIPLYNPYRVVMKSNLVLMDSFNSVKQKYVDIAREYQQVTIKEKLSSTLEREEYLNVSFGERNIDPHPNRLGHDAIARSLIDEIKLPEELDIQYSFDFSFLFISFLVIILLIGIGILVKIQNGK